MNTNAVTQSKQKLSQESCCPIVELRQYMLHPGKREELIELFDRALVDPQEAAGMRVIGQFRDLDDPNAFVWLRGFADMPSRARALNAFYGGPVWKKHREAANRTMIDSDNVLLLHPARIASGFALNSMRRPRPGAHGSAPGLLLATVYYLDEPSAEFTAYFEKTLLPLFRGAGAQNVAYFATENSPNNFPALPIREGEQVFAWFALFEDQFAHVRYEQALRSLPDSRGVLAGLMARVRDRPETLRLVPTAQSLLHA